MAKKGRTWDEPDTTSDWRDTSPDVQPEPVEVVVVPEPAEPVKPAKRIARLRYPGQIHVAGVSIHGGVATCLPAGFDESVLKDLIEFS